MISHRLNNLLHATLLLGGMAALLAVMGWLIDGVGGVVWAGLLGLGALWIGPRFSPHRVLRMSRAQPLTPLGAPGLYALIGRLAAAAQLPGAPVLYRIPSHLMNAFSVGRGREAVIAVTDGLLQGLSPRELTAVMAHEISHIAHNDMWIMSLADGVSRMVRLISFAAQILVIVNLPIYLLKYQSLPWLPLLLPVFAPALSGVLHMALSRNREFEADREAASLTGDPEGLVRALEKMESQRERLWRYLVWRQLIPLGRRNRESSLLRTHPGNAARAARLKEIAQAAQP